MQIIRDTVSQVMRDLKAKKSQSPGEDAQAWLKKILTKKELGHIKFKSFRSGVLYVHVDSAAWHYSLSLKKEKLVNRLTRDKRAVKDIRFSIGETR
ncbi:MAG: hypothetical protein A3K83_04505 [Omnitrophica WOR_2 bacterium RBG_13_44_8b]|nr:MAG: hypothetical protein A3K83_04505 [Omnitrophica WOR_2 bacterium RBG_13_44_8b]